VTSSSGHAAVLPGKQKRLQSRVRWMIRPGNELFLVVNHAWQYNTLDRLEAIISNVRGKLNYTFRF